MRRSHPGRPVLAAWLGLFLLAPSAAVQAPALARGETVRGTLGDGDLRLAAGHAYDAFTIEGRSGEVVTVTLRSADFDAYLVLARSSGPITEEVAADDDGGGGTDARVVRTLPADGPYIVVVRGLAPDAAGAYTLELGTLERRSATVTPIDRGETRVGALGAEDDFTDDLAYYELYPFEARAGERVAAVMRSGDFDTYVVVGYWDGETLVELAANDDGFGDGTSDSRVVVTLPEDGTYAVRATSLEGQQSGQFTVALDALAAAPAPSLTPIRAGESVAGELGAGDAELDDGSYYDLYAYAGAPGDRVTVTMRSEEFDTFLAVGNGPGADGFEEIASDDDGAGGTDSAITVEVPADGILLIRANSLAGATSGVYTLTVRPEGK